MKKISCIALVSIFVFVAQAQDFNTYFKNQSLRINYIHSGTKDVDNIEIAFFQKNNVWAGSMTHLIDPNDYGCHKIEVYDSASNLLLYSRTYSCLFGEYRTTEVGKRKEDFKETVMSVSQKTVRIEFYTCKQQLALKRKRAFCKPEIQ